MGKPIVKIDNMRLVLVYVIVFSSMALQAQQPVQPFALVNSTFDEQSPVVSPDGKLLFLTIGNHASNVGGKRDPGDIWFSVWTGGQWSAPIHAGAELNDHAYNAVAGFSADGSQLFLLCHYDKAAPAARTQGISVSRKTASGWSRPENISIPYFQNKSSLQSGYVSANGKIFVFSADSYGSRGVEDIYVSVKKDGAWSEPKNVGSIINTRFQELSPSLSMDGMTLYFSSNGGKGLGSFDVYSAKRLDDTWTTWSDPVNLGPAVNTEGRELFFKPDGKGTFVFTSTTNSDGYGDIKQYEPPEKDTVILAYVEKPDTTIRIQEVKHEAVNDKFIHAYGQTTNAKTGEVIPAKITFESADTVIVASAVRGEYKADLNPVSSYEIEIEAPGFVNVLEKLDLNTYELKTVELNFKLQPIEVGTTVTLKNVLFMQSKPELLPESYHELNVVVQFMKANPHVEIELSGHTDNRGSFRQLMSLSQQRVNKVKSYLVSKGINSKRIVGKGYGGSKPIASNDSEETRMLNRRVEFTIKKL